MMDVFKEPLPASLLAKLGAIAVHADEATSDAGHQFDVASLRAILADEQVKQFLKYLGPLAPLKRNTP